MDVKFRAQLRIIHFLTGAWREGLPQRQSLILLGSAFFTFILLIALPESASLLILPLLLGHWYILDRLLKLVHRRIQPPPEVVLLSGIIFLNILLKFSGYVVPFVPAGQTLIPPGMFFSFIQLSLCAVVLFHLVVLLTHMGGRHWGILILLYLLAGLFGLVLADGPGLLLIISMVLLFSVFIPRTDWLEQLTKAECWLYILIGLMLLNTVYGLVSVPLPQTTENTLPMIWFALPYFLYYSFVTLLTVLVVRIPIVMVYNHAKLHRKLKFASLFQSTFPQLMQFLTMLVVFYFFLAGWQAEQLNRTLTRAIAEARTDQSSLEVGRLPYEEVAASQMLKLDGYLPYHFQNLPKDDCAIVMEQSQPSPPGQQADFFFLLTPTEADSALPLLRLVKIDSQFVNRIGANLKLFAGNTLQAYPLEPGRWGQWLYRRKFFFFNWRSNAAVHSLPFCLVPQDAGESVTALIRSGQEDEGRQSVNISIGGMSRSVLGRSFVPFFSSDSEKPAYFVFDIVAHFDSMLVYSGLPWILLVIGLFYLLVNSFVIQSMVKMGARINKHIVERFDKLRDGISEVSEGNLDYKIRFDGEDDFVELANRFNEMGERLKSSMHDLQEKSRLEYELQNAREVQLSLLPAELPQIQGYQIAADLETATEVGGDLYDVIELGEGRHLIIVGDVSGKGSSAAFYMAQCISLIRYSRRFTDDPVEICIGLNDYFASSAVDRQIFLTAVIGILDANTNSFSFVRAGHTCPLLIPADPQKDLNSLEVRGLGIGLTNSPEILRSLLITRKIDFEPGDTLLIYTDGVIEANRSSDAGDKQEMFGEEKLFALLRRFRNRSASELMRGLQTSLDDFYDGAPRVDDHTLMILHRAARSV